MSKRKDQHTYTEERSAVKLLVMAFCKSLV
jgi:hypothetical protein